MRVFVKDSEMKSATKEGTKLRSMQVNADSGSALVTETHPKRNENQNRIITKHYILSILFQYE